MTSESKMMAGIILITVPSIEYGGYFLLRVLMGGFKQLALTPFQKSMFRAGHAHAGVIVLLSLICQLLADETTLPGSLLMSVRIGVPLSAILISAGFFFSAMGKDLTKPNRWIILIYIGSFVLALSLVVLGIGLIRPT